VISGRGVLSALVYLHGKDYITVDGFELEPGSSHWVSAPELMVLENCRGVEILNCRRGAAIPAAGTGTGIFARGCSDLRIEGNVLWGARYTLRIFGCRGVLIKNNTLALKSVVTVQIGDTGLEGHGIQFINNLLFENRSFRNGFFWINHQSAVEIDYNLYHTSDPKLKVGLVLDGNPEPVYVGDTLASWQRLSGLDAHSIDADPQLVDPDNRDFRLRPGSPAIGAGKDGANIGALGVAE
jgi:hypothetical protein